MIQLSWSWRIDRSEKRTMSTSHPTKKFCDMFRNAQIAERKVAEMTRGSSGFPNLRSRRGVICLGVSSSSACHETQDVRRQPPSLTPKTSDVSPRQQPSITPSDTRPQPPSPTPQISPAWADKQEQLLCSMCRLRLPPLLGPSRSTYNVLLLLLRTLAF